MIEHADGSCVIVLEVDNLAGLLCTQVKVRTFRSTCLIVVFHGVYWNNIHKFALLLCHGKGEWDPLL